MVFLARKHYGPYAEIEDFVVMKTLVSVRPHSAWLVIMPLVTQGFLVPLCKIINLHGCDQLGNISHGLRVHKGGRMFNNNTLPTPHMRTPRSHSSASKTQAPSKLHDALIIGGGPAGLSVALGLARQHNSCVVISDSKFRNEGAEAMHAVASRDGERLAVFRPITREQIAKYGNTTFVDMIVIGVSKEGVNGYDGFRAADKEGRDWIGKKTVFASGSKDISPRIEGYKEN
jgi:Pyridine nucleotide-disulphide oxidoreductase